MPAKAGLTPQRVVDAALAIVDESGAEALTLTRVAERTGVAPPSLYKHVAGLPELRRLVRLRVLAEFDEAIRTATLGRAGEAALRSLATAYRNYLRAHPHRYPFLEVAPDPDDPEELAMAERVVSVPFAVLRGHGLTGSAAVHATRCLRAAIYGFTRLEATGGFGLPEDIETTFEYLLDMVVHTVTGLRQQQ
ncbi:MAG TPA: WHG domain-containing protein [Natronosporangium sp.]